MINALEDSVGGKIERELGIKPWMIALAVAGVIYYFYVMRK